MTSQTRRPNAGGGAFLRGLTAREMTILCLIAAGLTNDEVSRRLHISRHTVAQHIADMLQRASGQEPSRTRRPGLYRGHAQHCRVAAVVRYVPFLMICEPVVGRRSPS